MHRPVAGRTRRAKARGDRFLRGCNARHRRGAEPARRDPLVAPGDPAAQSGGNARALCARARRRRGTRARRRDDDRRDREGPCADRGAQAASGPPAQRASRRGATGGTCARHFLDAARADRSYGGLAALCQGAGYRPRRLVRPDAADGSGLCRPGRDGRARPAARPPDRRGRRNLCAARGP